jgi:ankyrin repeat protein
MFMNQFLSARDGNVESLQLLCENVNATDDCSSGWTALHYAAWKGHIACVQWLLERGASALLRDASGQLPLHLSARYGHSQCCRLLVRASGDCDIDSTISDDDYFTPLYWAIYNKHDRCAIELLDMGASLSLVTFDAFISEIPHIVREYPKARARCLRATAITLSVHRQRGAINNVDVLRLIGRLVWASRMEVQWRL